MNLRSQTLRLARAFLVTAGLAAALGIALLWVSGRVSRVPVGGADTGSALPAGAVGEDPFPALRLVRPAASTSAPDFTVPRLAGPPLTLSELKGQVVFLNFWATWCPPCKEEMPSMERLYRRHREQGFMMVALSVDTNTPAVPPFVKYFGLTFPIGLDPKMGVATRYGMRALPTTALIDRDGWMVGVAVGPRDWDSAAAHTLIGRLLER